jgi:hypothetical protein
VAGGIDLKLRLTLREGSVYYFSDRSLTSGEPHYFIVVNRDPLAQQLLLLAVTTTKIKAVKQRRADCPETLVEFTPDSSNVFTNHCIADCNDLKQVALDEFNARFVSKAIKYFDKDLPASARKALCKAIHASTILPAELKALVSEF